jgi:rubredoxin
MRKYQAERWRTKGRKERRLRRKRPEASHRKSVGLGGTDLARRTCLACGQTFWSEGPANRRCPRCTTALSGVVETPVRRVFI